MTAQHDDTKASARNRIMDAAEQLICERGVAGFTLDAVAKAAVSVRVAFSTTSTPRAA
jgi:AcrR family transcriptional regulator